MTLPYELSRLVNEVAIDRRVLRTDILGKSRLAATVDARFMVITRAYTELGMSIYEIADGLSLDRASVYHALDREGVDMAIQHHRLELADYQVLKRQMQSLIERHYKGEDGVYHKAIRLRIGPNKVMEFHGPLVREPGASLKGTTVKSREKS